VRRFATGLIVGVLVVGSGVAGALSADKPTQTRAKTSPAAQPTPSASSVIENAELATVLLSWPCESKGRCRYGSGTVIDSGGLILTNAHVASPASPGLGGQYDDLQDNVTNPPYLVVSVPPSADGDAVPRYRASVVAVDGYADLAVVRIDADLAGHKLTSVPPLRSIPLGRLADVKKAADVWVIGYPASADSQSPSVHRGSIVSKPTDPRKRVTGPWELNTDADIHAGNSGGAVIDATGKLIGIPTYSRGYTDVTYRARAVDLARPLLDAAKSGAPYTSAHLVPATGMESLTSVDWGDADLECGDTGQQPPFETPEVLLAEVQLSDMSDGEDYKLELIGPGGKVFKTTQNAWDEEVDCAEIGYAAFLGNVPAGTYVVKAYVGPDRTPIGEATTSVIAPETSAEGD
jgi:putative serine protease PepD